MHVAYLPRMISILGGAAANDPGRCDSPAGSSLKILLVMLPVVCLDVLQDGTGAQGELGEAAMPEV